MGKMLYTPNKKTVKKGNKTLVVCGAEALVEKKAKAKVESRRPTSSESYPTANPTKPKVKAKAKKK